MLLSREGWRGLGRSHVFQENTGGKGGQPYLTGTKRGGGGGRGAVGKKNGSNGINVLHFYCSYIFSFVFRLDTILFNETVNSCAYILFYHKRQFPNRGKLPGVAFVVLAMSPLWVTTALRRPTLLLSNLVVNSHYIKCNLKCGCYFDRQIEQMKATIPIHRTCQCFR